DAAAIGPIGELHSAGHVDSAIWERAAVITVGQSTANVDKLLLKTLTFDSTESRQTAAWTNGWVCSTNQSGHDAGLLDGFVRWVRARRALIWKISSSGKLMCQGVPLPSWQPFSTPFRSHSQIVPG